MASTDNDRQKHIGQAEKRIREAAEQIDPYTARMVWWYAQTLDPYGHGYDLSPAEEQVGREYFLEDPKGNWPVLVHDVRKLHPEIRDEEWKQLMRAAAERDDSPDPFPLFHRYRGGRIEVKASQSSSTAPDEPKEDHMRDAGALFERLVEAVAERYGLDYEEAMGFIGEACSAGGLSTEDEELIDSLLESVRHIAYERGRSAAQHEPF